jgi:hypothetical protein
MSTRPHELSPLQVELAALADEVKALGSAVLADSRRPAWRRLAEAARSLKAVGVTLLAAAVVSATQALPDLGGAA